MLVLVYVFLIFLIGQRTVMGIAADAKHSTKRYQYQLEKDFWRFFFFLKLFNLIPFLF